MLEDTNKTVTAEMPAEEEHKAPKKKSGKKTTVKETAVAEPAEVTEVKADEPAAKADEPAAEHHTTKKKSASKSHTAKKTEEEPATAAPAEVKPEGERKEKNEIQDIIDKAKIKGSISNSEIMVSLGDTDYDLDQIDKLYETLESMGIDVTEDFDDDEPIDLDEDIEADLENFESSESMEKPFLRKG